jgi:hypothetical protein
MKINKVEQENRQDSATGIIGNWREMSLTEDSEKVGAAIISRCANRRGLIGVQFRNNPKDIPG